ncbi:MAG: hypothetical protein ABW185_04655, partial [Sedimenticola sp.]
DQPAQSAQANPGQHFPLSGEIMLQESLLYTFITHGQEMSGRIRLRGLRKAIRVDTLRTFHTVGFLAMRDIGIKSHPKDQGPIAGTLL